MEGQQEGTRTWNTDIRSPWNPVIKQCLIAIDLHVDLYLQTRQETHLKQADVLREYVRNLKDWILSEEVQET
jgi:hypothetical protein